MAVAVRGRCAPVCGFSRAWRRVPFFEINMALRRAPIYGFSKAQSCVPIDEFSSSGVSAFADLARRGGMAHLQIQQGAVAWVFVGGRKRVGMQYPAGIQMKYNINIEGFPHTTSCSISDKHTSYKNQTFQPNPHASKKNKHFLATHKSNTICMLKYPPSMPMPIPIEPIKVRLEDFRILITCTQPK